MSKETKAKVEKLGNIIFFTLMIIFFYWFVCVIFDVGVITQRSMSSLSDDIRSEFNLESKFENNKGYYNNKFVVDCMGSYACSDDEVSNILEMKQEQGSNLGVYFKVDENVNYTYDTYGNKEAIVTKDYIKFKYRDIGNMNFDNLTTDEVLDFGEKYSESECFTEEEAFKEGFDGVTASPKWNEETGKTEYMLEGVSNNEWYDLTKLNYYTTEILTPDTSKIPSIPRVAYTECRLIPTNDTNTLYEEECNTETIKLSDDLTTKEKQIIREKLWQELRAYLIKKVG